MPILPLDPVPHPDPVALGLALADGACRLAPATRAEGGLAVGEVDAALAAWASGQGRLVAVPAATPDCDGPPPPTVVPVPAGGWALGLAVAPVAVVADGLPAAAVLPLGADRTWWHVPSAAGQVGFTFPGDAPPARFVLAPDPGVLPPAGWVVTVPVGEARATAAEGTPVVAALEPAGVAAVVGVAGQVVVLGLEAGVADGQVREGAGAPQPIHVAVSAAPQPPVALAVRAGRAKRWSLDAPVREVAVLDPAVARAEVEGGRLRVTGVRGGVTWAALVLADGGIEVVAIVVDG